MSSNLKYKKIISRKNTRLETTYDENLFILETENTEGLCIIGMREREVRKLHKTLSDFLKFREYLRENF